MGRNTAIEKSARANNSGGVYPEPMSMGLALLRALYRLHTLPTSKTRENSLTLYDKVCFHFLYFWLTGQLNEVKATKDVPAIAILSGTEACHANALRRVRMNGISWVEYALLYETHDGRIWQWQPMPDGLNMYFSQALTQTVEHWNFNQDEKRQFIAWLTKKWRTPTSLKGRYLVRSDVLFRYFQTMAGLDNALTVQSKRILLGDEGLHHRSASAYQRQDSEQSRHDIFLAQNRYLDRLYRELIQPDLLPMLNVMKPMSRLTIPALHKNAKRPEYLTKSGRIASHNLELSDGARRYVFDKNPTIGSRRALAIDQVRRFFRHLSEQGQQLTNVQHTLSSLRTLCNFRAYELALLFTVMTGTRPTHAISIERRLSFDMRHAMVCDKGRYRTIVLCDYLRRAMMRYEALTQRLAEHLAGGLPSPLMWFHVNEQETPVPLTAKTLRIFMLEHWRMCAAGEHAVPYQLRHVFAQHALTSLNPVLSTQDIDYLMGHSQFGEHLGSEMHFPASQRKRDAHLNGIADYLQLPAIK